MTTFICALNFKIMPKLKTIHIRVHIQTGFTVLFKMLTEYPSPCLTFCIGAASTTLMQSTQGCITKLHINHGHLHIRWYGWCINRNHRWLRFNRFHRIYGINWSYFGGHRPIIFPTTICSISAGQLNFSCTCRLCSTYKSSCCVSAINHHYRHRIDY